MELIRFIFQSVWHFIGTVILLCVVFEGIADIIKSIKNK